MNNEYTSLEVTIFGIEDGKVLVAIESAVQGTLLVGNIPVTEFFDITGQLRVSLFKYNGRQYYIPLASQRKDGEWNITASLVEPLLLIRYLAYCENYNEPVFPVAGAFGKDFYYTVEAAEDGAREYIRQKLS